MSHNCHTDICSNVMRIGYTKSLEELESGMDSNEDEITTGYQLCGWTLKQQGVYVGKKQRIWADLYVKDDLEVYLINESQYSNVGEYEWTIFGNDELAVATFCVDLKAKTGSIEPEDTVSYWC